MSTWMMIVSVWVMFAVCVVLFVRGASSRVHREADEVREEATPANVEPSRVKV
jgi:flagellar basal body-associated protein FliL